MKPLLSIENFSLNLRTRHGVIEPLTNISLEIREGETVGLVGESGCGKSVLAMSILGLLKNTEVKSGEIFFEGKPLSKFSEAEMRRLRGAKVSMIFQDPLSSLNPVMRVKNQIAEAMTEHGTLSAEEALAESRRLLEICGIRDAGRVLQNFPHELSGGMRQRVMIAMALACKPKLMLADEPTTALDVTVQAQVLGTMKKIQREFNTALLFVSHDLLVIEKMCSRVFIMYAGQIVESGTTAEVLRSPQHPYTKALLACKPKAGEKKAELATIPGNVPSVADFALNCRFAPRCSLKFATCEQKAPELKPIAATSDHKARCFFVEGKHL